jgi:3-oxoacyl-[acyl-carrier protein] reductase
VLRRRGVACAGPSVPDDSTDGPMISLAGKAALVTGGSRGIGAATVKLFAEAGADVVFNFHRARDAARQVELEARKHGTRVKALRADLGRMEEAKRLVLHAVKSLGRLDVVVVNSGIWNAEDAPIEALGEREWDEMIRVNLKSAYAVAHYAAAQMITQKRGRMILVSSTAGQRGEAFHSHYAATKGAVISFVKSLATELARYGILVNCVAPGWVDTDMSRPVLAKAGAKVVISAIPMGRVGTAAEIAGPILFLASDLATFVTGEVLNVNGGAVLCG